eukprot:GHVL01015199.1.p1 GENE.GHVL01015199.1~~GHVL01015199.1.p1  ORF type:complete len:102 (-),score=5.77 GHVL01015199.1:957-1262(-)
MLMHVKVARNTLDIPDLDMRIGLHFGSFIGGVIGREQLRYDVWGMDTRIAMLVEQNGVPGQIVASENLVTFLKGTVLAYLKWEYHTRVKINQEIELFKLCA